jgi:valyl-tRNA synthetase
MGHALNGSIQDTLIRYHRMLGQRAKWILGTDHAGIATQTQVERLLVSEGSSREEIGREAFVERVWQWREQYGGTIIEQYKRLGATVDYDDERFTLDDTYVQAVLQVFVTLFEKGYIYRDNYLVNWDPGSQSAISELEVEDRECTDTLYWIDYPLASGSGSVTIATVRPETMLGDTAIAVHPDDERYTRLVGEYAILPLVGRKLKIIADPYVKPDFGTGALKITPGHDPNDFEIGRSHSLEEISVIGEDGRMTDAATEPYAGMTVMEARDAVVDALREQGLISHTEPYTHEVPHSQRSGERIEPLISLQWFMAMDELAKPAIEAVRDGRIRILPVGQERRYLNWMENIRPWCISRQLWWGHQIPVWYREGKTYVGMTPPREGDGWERDPDVLDTWFSSGLWPFATLGWPEQTDALRAFYPTDVLLTARDILFLWVARMVMLGMEFNDGQIPFRDVYVHSVIQAPDGRRMSKSLGTGIDPVELIDSHGADATRFGLLAMSSTQDVRFNEERIGQGAQLANKLWNASRLILMRANDGDVARRSELERTEGRDVARRSELERTEGRNLPLEDRWILSRLARAKEALATSIENYEFHRAADGLYHFVYDDLCDWYLEIVKPRLETEGGVARKVLAETLAMAHPMIPFVTEEIWSFVGEDGGLLAESRWPERDLGPVDEQAEAEIGAAIEIIRAVRAWRDSLQVKPGAVLPARLDGHAETADIIANLARLSWEDGGEAAVRVGAVSILPTGDVDFDAGQRRIEKERSRLEEEIRRLKGKLANEKFVSRAPEAVVQAERDKLEAFQRELAAL